LGEVLREVHGGKVYRRRQTVEGGSGGRGGRRGSGGRDGRGLVISG